MFGLATSLAPGISWRKAGGASAAPLANPLSFGADLVGWWHADDTTPSSWPDRSLNGYNLVQATGSNQPAVSSTSFMGKSGVTFDGIASWMKATGVALDSDKFTCYAFCQFTSGTNTNLRVVAFEGNAVGNDFTGPGSAILIQNKGDTLQLNAYRSGPLSGFQFGVPANATIPTAGIIYRVGSEWDGSNHTMYVDGEAATPVASTGSLASPGNIQVGANADGTASFWDGVVHEIIITKNILTSGQRQTLMDHMARDWTKVLLCEGDSVTYAPPANSGYTYLFLPNAAPPVILENEAIGGSHLSDLVSRVSSRVYARLPSNKWGKKYIFFVYVGVLDIANYQGLGTTAGPIQYAADLASYCAGVKTAGADKVVITTILSRTDIGPDHDVSRGNFNTIIRNASWQTSNGIDAVVDFAADPIMGIDAAPTVNSAYFTDVIHPNAAGNTRLEPIFRAVINAL